MKNIYLVLLVMIALAVFILGLAIFIADIKSPEITQSQVETTQPQKGEQGAVEIIEIESTEQAGQGTEVVVTPLPSPSPLTPESSDDINYFKAP